MLQIAANPYITILGPERTASSRLNLSQAFNSFGTTIGPIIAGLLIFKVFNGPGSHGAQSVKIPYLRVGGGISIIGGLFHVRHTVFIYGAYDVVCIYRVLWLVRLPRGQKPNRCAVGSFRKYTCRNRGHLRGRDVAACGIEQLRRC